MIEFKRTKADTLSFDNNGIIKKIKMYWDKYIIAVIIKLTFKKKDWIHKFDIKIYSWRTRWCVMEKISNSDELKKATHVFEFCFFFIAA